MMQIDFIPDGSVVLDVGCACGDFGVALRKCRPASVVYGLDGNLGSVEIAVRTEAYAEVRSLDLDDPDVSSLDGYEKKFDVIVFGDVLEHLREPQKVLRTFSRFLKGSGCFVVSLPNVAHVSIKANLLLNDFRYTPVGILDETHLRFFTCRTIPAFFSDIGLEVEECRFTLQQKQGWQPCDPFPSLSVPIRRFLFEDWHSFVCQYVMKVIPSDGAGVDVESSNAVKLQIDGRNALPHLSAYRKRLLDELEVESSRTRDALKLLCDRDESIRLLSERVNQLKLQKRFYRFLVTGLLLFFALGIVHCFIFRG